MSGSISKQSILDYSTIGANLVTIFTGIIGLLLALKVFFYFFGNKKHKAIVISSKTFQIPLEKEDIVKASFPIKIYDETIDFQYDKNEITPLEYCNKNRLLLEEIKGKYNPICVFGISEMFLPFWIGYYLQDSICIKTFTKLKEGQIKFLGNPWAWPKLFSLKWLLWIKGIIKSLRCRYSVVGLDKLTGTEVNLIINISYKVDENNIPQSIKNNHNIFFGIEKTDSSFLVNERQVNMFYKKIKEILKEIEEKIGDNGKVNIFSTLPIPFCIKLGQAIHRNFPECVFFDFDRSKNQYMKVISTKDINI